MIDINRLLKLCEEHDIKKTELERKCGMSQNSINKWKTSSPSADKLELVADIFNTSVDYLLVRTDETKPYPPSSILKSKKFTETIEPATDIAERITENNIANDATPIPQKAPFPKLMELPEDFTPTGAIPLSPIEYGIPIVGVVRAGIGGAAHENIEGYESVSKSDLNGHDTSEYFWLRVKGDSMEPELYEGDLVLVHKQTSVDSGTLAVVLVDDIADSEGLVKIIHYGKDWIELVSNNENYPPRRFEQQDVLRIYVVGAVVQSKRIYSRVNRYKAKI